MPREEYRVDLSADNEISDEARKAAKDLDQLPERVEVEIEAKSSLDKALDEMEQVRQEAASVAIAAEEMGRALGPELAARTDTSAVVAELQKLGLSADEVTANADQLAAKLREIDSPDLGGGLGRALGTARGEAEKLTDSARGANSALANMVGNSAQDLGALGGAAGSTGVAIGQMAEYFSDAALGGERMGSAFKSMLAVAGPIAALTAIVSSLGSIFEAQRMRTERLAEATEQLSGALKDGGDEALTIADAMRENIDALRSFDADARTAMGGFVEGVAGAVRALPLLGGAVGDAGQNITDVAEAFDKAGISAYDLGRALADGGEEVFAWKEVLRLAAREGKITADQASAAAQALDVYGDAAAAAAAAQGLFNVDQKEANALLQEMVAQADPLEQMADVWATLFRDMADGSIDTKQAADAVNELAAALGLTQAEVIALAREHLDERMEATAEAATATASAFRDVAAAMADGQVRVDAFAGVLDRLNADTPLAFADRAAETVESFDQLKTALSEVQDIGSRPLAPTAVEDLRGLSDESAAVIDAMGGMRDAIQTELVGALESAGGNFDAVRDKAGFFRDEVTAQFTEAFQQMGLGPEEVDAKVTELLGNLGLLPSQVETQIRLTQADEAMRKIELFGSAIANLPPEVQAKVAAAVDANDPVTAWNLINAGVQAQGAVPIGTELDTTGAESGAAGFADSEQPTAVISLDADPAIAEDVAEDFTSERRITTPVQVDASTALATAMLLAFLAKPRATTIHVGTSGVPEVDATLDRVAAARSSTIRAELANIAAVDRALDAAARDRTATITVRTIDTRLVGTRD